jgi:hypothetical protein
MAPNPAVIKAANVAISAADQPTGATDTISAMVRGPK